MDNKFELQKERDLGENISGIFVILRSQFKKLLGSVIMIAGPAIILLSIISAYIGMRDLDALTTNIYEETGFLERYKNSFLTYGVLWFGNAMVSLVTFSYLKVYKNVSDYRDITTDMVWKEAKKHFLNVIVASIISGIVIGVGTIFIFVPGIILAVFLSMYVPSVVFEEFSIGQAFNRSFKLVSDNFWITLGLAIVVSLITYLFNLAFSIPTIILTAIWSFNSLDTLSQGEGFTEMSDSFSTMVLLASLLANLASMLVSIIPNLSIALHFFTLREKKESSSLMDQISTMGNTKSEEKEIY